MTKTPSDGQRLPWTTPQLRRIEAGSAEAKTTSGVADGAVKSPQKS
jgi:hypothetical protein